MIDFTVDFQQGSLRYRHDHLQGRNELIAKAIGFKKGMPLHVLDATAGWGREAFLLAALGCEVTLCERHPVVSTLLEKALHQAKNDPALQDTISRMTLIKSCAMTYLQAHPDISPDIIYCDPMFPLRQKSALVKKEMQILHTLVGEDKDSEDLVKLCYLRAQKRVVVKRALRAPLLFPAPSMTYKARSHRFDVYVRQA
ncbi:MAG: class I SAM-dependent methyltransferase [Proteobacteria bacterium]|nr:class I SAM-dependent methyltransferase [Pseudomonadota bacterium]